MAQQAGGGQLRALQKVIRAFKQHTHNRVHRLDLQLWKQAATRLSDSQAGTQAVTQAAVLSMLKALKREELETRVFQPIREHCEALEPLVTFFQALEDVVVALYTPELYAQAMIVYTFVHMIQLYTPAFIHLCKEQSPDHARFVAWLEESRARLQEIRHDATALAAFRPDEMTRKLSTLLANTRFPVELSDAYVLREMEDTGKVLQTTSLNFPIAPYRHHLEEARKGLPVIRSQNASVVFARPKERLPILESFFSDSRKFTHLTANLTTFFPLLLTYLQANWRLQTVLFRPNIHYMLLRWQLSESLKILSAENAISIAYLIFSDAQFQEIVRLLVTSMNRLYEKILQLDAESKEWTKHELGQEIKTVNLNSLLNALRAHVDHKFKARSPATSTFWKNVCTPLTSSLQVNANTYATQLQQKLRPFREPVHHQEIREIVLFVIETNLRQGVSVLLGPECAELAALIQSIFPLVKWSFQPTKPWYFKFHLELINFLRRLVVHQKEIFALCRGDVPRAAQWKEKIARTTEAFVAAGKKLDPDLTTHHSFEKKYNHLEEKLRAVMGYITDAGRMLSAPAVQLMAHWTDYCLCLSNFQCFATGAPTHGNLKSAPPTTFAQVARTVLQIKDTKQRRQCIRTLRKMLVERLHSLVSIWKTTLGAGATAANQRDMTDMDRFLQTLKDHMTPSLLRSPGEEYLSIVTMIIVRMFYTMAADMNKVIITQLSSQQKRVAQETFQDLRKWFVLERREGGPMPRLRDMVTRFVEMSQPFKLSLEPSNASLGQRNQQQRKKWQNSINQLLLTLSKQQQQKQEAKKGGRKQATSGGAAAGGAAGGGGAVVEREQQVQQQQDLLTKALRASPKTQAPFPSFKFHYFQHKDRDAGNPDVQLRARKQQNRQNVSRGIEETGVVDQIVAASKNFDVVLLVDVQNIVRKMEPGANYATTQQVLQSRLDQLKQYVLGLLGIVTTSVPLPRIMWVFVTQGDIRAGRYVVSEHDSDTWIVHIGCSVKRGAQTKNCFEVEPFNNPMDDMFLLHLYVFFMALSAHTTGDQATRKAIQTLQGELMQTLKRVYRQSREYDFIDFIRAKKAMRQKLYASSGRFPEVYLVSYDKFLDYIRIVDSLLS